MSSDPEMITIHSLDEIPDFANEDEEFEFWQTHEFIAELAAAASPIPVGVLPPPRPRTRATPIRFDGDMLARLKVLAAEKGTGYQTLIKQFVGERLYEEEKREGLVGAPSARGSGGRVPRSIPAQTGRTGTIQRPGEPELDWSPEENVETGGSRRPGRRAGSEESGVQEGAGGA